MDGNTNKTRVLVRTGLAMEVPLSTAVAVLLLLAEVEVISVPGAE